MCTHDLWSLNMAKLKKARKVDRYQVKNKFVTNNDDVIQLGPLHRQLLFQISDEYFEHLLLLTWLI